MRGKVYNLLHNIFIFIIRFLHNPVVILLLICLVSFYNVSTIPVCSLMPVSNTPYLDVVLTEDLHHNSFDFSSFEPEEAPPVQSRAEYRPPVEFIPINPPVESIPTVEPVPINPPVESIPAVEPVPSGSSSQLNTSNLGGNRRNSFIFREVIHGNNHNLISLQSNSSINSNINPNVNNNYNSNTIQSMMNSRSVTPRLVNYNSNTIQSMMNSRSVTPTVNQSSILQSIAASSPQIQSTMQSINESSSQIQSTMQSVNESSSQVQGTITQNVAASSSQIQSNIHEVVNMTGSNSKPLWVTDLYNLNESWSNRAKNPIIRSNLPWREIQLSEIVQLNRPNILGINYNFTHQNVEVIFKEFWGAKAFYVSHENIPNLTRSNYQVSVIDYYHTRGFNKPTILLQAILIEDGDVTKVISRGR
uniref:hypothetical protein n=1 Tax=Cordyceps farinosa TaxID=89141 RepID=UPI002237FD9E|nr:hypothetical protein OQ237_mgp08 [Cordyceps farinosa]UYO78919.1 hypothetical protein [Cordyceps farinosa]